MHEQLIKDTQTASNQWKDYFNQGDAKGCTSMYEQNALMIAQPFGEFNGHGQIEAFWQELIDQGFTAVEYVNPSIEVIDDKTTLLKSEWTMNKAQGVITKELWVRQSDGTMRLQDDRFEAK